MVREVFRLTQWDTLRVRQFPTEGDPPSGLVSPSHDTFARVLAALEPGELQDGFLSWVSSISEQLGIELIHIDGKTARGSYDREEKLKALHSVSAWSSTRCSLGTTKSGWQIERNYCRADLATSAQS